MYRNIVVAVDGSKHAMSAVDEAASLATGADASLTLVHVGHVIDETHIPRQIKAFGEIEKASFDTREVVQRASQEILNEAADRARRAGAKSVQTRALVGDPAHQVVKAAEEINADLIVAGSRGLGDVGSFLLGSVAHKILHKANRPVLVAHAS